MVNHPNRSRKVATGPTEDEFKAARSDAELDGEHGEDAYQLCRWFRGQMFLRERAERWLTAHRAALQ